jgi:mannose/fructose/N-acetylgalactosamine-specific phosphotransferase system component IID
MKKFLVFFRVFLRSFFIQSGWNYKSLLSIGFCFALLPVAKTLYRNDISGYNQFVKRHLGFFNSHPFFASFALGSAIRLEQELAAGKGDVAQIDKLKNAMIGPLGALGDQIFWAVVKPATFSLGVLGFFILENTTARLIFLLILGILYNVPHLYVRIKGLIQGYKEGFLICKFLRIDNFKFLKNSYLFVGIIALGLTSGWIAVKQIELDPLSLLVFCASIFCAAFYKSKKSKTYYAMLVPIVIALVIGVIKTYI